MVRALLKGNASSAAWGLMALCATVAAAAAEDGVRPIDVGNRKQLFIDTSFFAVSENISLHIVPPAKSGERTLVSDRPWEDASLNWFSVMDDGGTYRMWYECYDSEGWPTTDDTSFCYAESKDAIHWTKPSLGLFAYHGSNDTNILFRQIGPENARSRVHGAGVFKDPSAPPEARYKAVSQGMFAGHDPPYRVAGMVSPDGLRWTRYAQPICDVFADSQYSAFWDADSSAFMLFGRVGGHGRAIGRSTSLAFDRFDPLALVLETGDADPPDSDLYNPAALKYPYADHAYFMFPSLYRHDTDSLDIRLAVSRDGIHWSWPERGAPFVPLGGAGAFDSGSLYMGQGLVRAGGEIFMYYSGSPLKHNEAELDALMKEANKRVFSRVTTRVDGFVSADAGDKEGSFITPPIVFAGSALHLNMKARADGEVRVELLDADDKPLDGHTLADCPPLTGDEIDAVVVWKSKADLSGIAGTPIKLHVAMKNASLFAFQFK